MSTDPWRPTTVETVIYEPDEQAVIAVLPGALWLQAGDIVELDDPPREARVLSSRLQLRPREPARVLIVLDVPDAALQGDTAPGTMLGADIDAPSNDDDLEDELERLTDEVDTEPTPHAPSPPRKRSGSTHTPRHPGPEGLPDNPAATGGADRPLPPG